MADEEQLEQIINNLKEIIQNVLETAMANKEMDIVISLAATLDALRRALIIAEYRREHRLGEGIPIPTEELERLIKPPTP